MRRIIQVLSGWWCNADETSFLGMMAVLLGISTVYVVLGTINLDQLTTIDVGSVLSKSLAVLGGFVAALFAARSWFGGQRDTQYRMPMWRVRRDRWVSGFYAAHHGSS